MISASPARGPEPIQRRSFAILVSETANVRSAPDVSTRPSRLAWASNGSAGGRIRRPVCSAQQRAHAGGELGMRVQAGADGGAAERDLAQPLERRVDRGRGPRAPARRSPPNSCPSVTGTASIRCVRPDLTTSANSSALPCQRGGEPVERGLQLVDDPVERGQVHRRREHVVRRLAHVDVIVGVHPLAGERGDHLVRVHVRRGAGAGLEDVDRELAVVRRRRRPRRRRPRSGRPCRRRAGRGRRSRGRRRP